VIARLPAQLAVAALAGACAVLSFAPFYAWFLAPVSLALLFALWWQAPSTGRAFALGMAWGFGLFVAGVSWLYVSLHVFGNMPALMAAFSIALFCAYLALFVGLAGVVQHRFRARMGSRPVAGLLLVMPAAFVAFEWLRGWFLSGFPWLSIGYSQTPGGVIGAPLAGYAPMVGAFGISWLMAMSAGVIALLAKRNLREAIGRRTAWMLGLGAVVVWGAGIPAGMIGWSEPSGAPITFSLLQGNIDQQLKWREDELAATLENYRTLADASRAKLIVLPETAVPLWLDQIPRDYLRELKFRAEKNGGDLLMGVPMVQRPDPRQPANTYFNSVISLGVSPTQGYSKSHLVIFGEFVPPALVWINQWLHIPLSGFTRGTDHPEPMKVAGISVAVNICYEDAYGDEVARQLPEANLLVNVSNMAWYGRSLAADQHAQMSQMRALETGRWMLRSTNTGVTAAINERGEIVKAMPQFARGTLDIDAQPRRGATPFVRWKDWPVLIGLVLALLAAFAMGRRPG
jgi:apolipoprotein N-acyltransferase